MEKLELKHIAPYLPYRLQLKCIGGIFRANRKELPLIKVADATLTPDLFADIYNKTFDTIGHFKPILHPLSNLTKKIEHNGEKFVPIVKLYELDIIDVYPLSTNFDIDDLHQYCNFGHILSLFEKLYKWHFDIHGLIEKGLAIDINTINK